MSGEPYCYNCGARTDLVTEAGDAICRTCLDARQPPPIGTSEEAEGPAEGTSEEVPSG
ncbi:MAG TPA: hypothetical protein VFA66_10180 [Gaiellaceae bacterium]|nr:hypothetical protein [Gaiellaceae bacterium]